MVPPQNALLLVATTGIAMIFFIFFLLYLAVDDYFQLRADEAYLSSCTLLFIYQDQLEDGTPQLCYDYFDHETVERF